MTDTLPPARRRRTMLIAALAITAALAAAVAALFAMRPDAHRLFEQGLAAGRQNPASGEILFRRAIQAAGGTYPDAQIALCHALAQRGAWDEALATFATLDRQACRADLLVAFGREAIRAEHQSQGLAALEAASQRGSPASVAALEILSHEYHAAGLMDKETAALYQLTELDSDNPEHWKRLVISLDGQRMIVEREKVLRRVLRLELPDYFRQEFEFQLINMLIEKGDVSESRRRTAELKKTEGESFRIGLAEVYLCRLEGRFEQAQSLATALHADAANAPALYYIRGILHFELNEYEAAVRDLERALQAQPHDEGVHFRLSEAYRLLKREDLAARHAKISAEITANRKRLNELSRQRSENPQDLDIVKQLADVNAELGDEKSAQYWTERAKRLRQSLSTSP